MTEENKENNQCYVCHSLITAEKASSEHVIPNALGGKLKSKDLICDPCNKDLGSKLDLILANEFRVLATLLQVDRDRGTNQSFDSKGLVTDEDYLIHPDGTFSSKHPNIQIEESIVDGKKQVRTQVKARSQKELDSIFKSLEAKYERKGMVLEQSEKHESDTKPSLLMSLTMGSTDIFKAIGKIAINFAKYHGLENHHFKPILAFINDEGSNHMINSFYPDDENWKKSDMIAHQLFLHGIPDQSILYCLVEILGFYKFFVLIDENYSGPQIHNAYQYDIINCLEFEDNTFDSLLARSDVANILAKRYFVKMADIEARARTILNSRNNFGFVFIERKKN